MAPKINRTARGKKTVSDQVLVPKPMRQNGPPTYSNRDLLEIGLSKTNARPKISQIEEVARHFTSRSLEGKLNKLPPNDEWTFIEIGESRIKDENTLDLKLFCGENPAYKTWAIVKVYSNTATKKRQKATEVLFINEYATGEKEFATEITDLALMYPLKVFKKRYSGSEYFMRQLKTLILYLYLDTGHATTVFPRDFKTARGYISSAIKRISDDYDAKGIDKVPNLHPPGEDFSFQRGHHPRTTSYWPPKKYDDDTKTVISDDDDEDDLTIGADQPLADKTSPVSQALNGMGPPDPLDLPASAQPDIESMVDTVSLADQGGPCSGTKRRADDNDTISELLHLKHARKELAREDTANREEAKKKHVLNRAKDREMKVKIEALLKEMSPGEFQKWALSGGVLGDEKE
ncbi:uncharacterized protein K460DRAFT_431460 [Cucurbitaria berberidis CBS 394.84]|uniref:Uncharacterized protein n=1 Tax=Cucurbitaria berberidis CBS 394.84 TaxID=1168544 RepID=A0A9P4GIT4_9PLEO|nr:uncharacterized protein K460DRAFT_431460 [Cucurbitaria berberidis CBS 394.84]KAF1846422.1 hypothetical protein K460DRAFT_431460 [Cucurbitaria berberidis CBS 394.84]